MLKRFLALVMMLLPIIAFAQGWVNPYVRRDGTMVEGHLRMRPDVGARSDREKAADLAPSQGGGGR